MYKKRFNILFGTISVLFMVILCKLFYIQMIQGGKYSGISNNKRIRTVDIDTLRGTIYDRNGSVLAMDKHSFELTVMYEKLFDTHSCFEQNILPKASEIKKLKINRNLCKECHIDKIMWVERVSGLLDIPYIDVFNKATKIVKKVESIKHAVEKRNKREMRIREETVPHSVVSHIPWEKVAKFEVEMLNLPGIQIETTPVRWYPQGNLSSHVIGYVGKMGEEEIKNYNFKKRWFDDLKKSGESESEFLTQKSISRDALIGKNGIEKIYNSRLMGIPGERFEEVTLDTMRVNKLILERPSTPGNNIFLTIDSRIQGIAEKALGKKKGSVIVMDPWNGEIIAIASFPRYNLNTFNKDYAKLSKNPLKPFVNRPVQSVLPPGSTFKIITAIAALEEGKIDKNTHFPCYGSLKVGNRRFRCHTKHGHGLLNVEEAIQYSCNIFFYETAKILGGTLLKKWAENFGFGSATGIELVYEQKGSFPEPRSISQTINLSIGQGAMLATPIQIVRMIATIANGGWYTKPHILRKISDHKGNTLVNNKYDLTEKLNISEKSMNIIRHSLSKVVTDGTAKKTGLKELHVAGKTGTSQTAIADENHAWFAGYAPFDNPKYCFVVVVEHTKGHGAAVAGPIVREILTQSESSL